MPEVTAEERVETVAREVKFAHEVLSEVEGDSVSKEDVLNLLQCFEELLTVE